MANYLSDNCYCNGDLYAVRVHSDILNSDVINADRVNTDELHYETMSFDTIAAESGDFGTLTARTLNCDDIHYETMTYDELTATTLNADTVNAGTINCDDLHYETMTTDKVETHEIDADIGTIDELTVNTLHYDGLQQDHITCIDLKASDKVETKDETVSNKLTSKNIDCENIDCSSHMKTYEFTSTGTVICGGVFATGNVNATGQQLVCGNATIQETASIQDGLLERAIISDSCQSKNITLSEHITLKNQRVEQWSDLSQYISGGGGSGIDIGDCIYGNDWVRAINNRDLTIYCNEFRKGVNMNVSDGRVKWKSRMMGTGTHVLSGTDQYSSIRRCLLPFANRFWNNNYSLNYIPRIDSDGRDDVINFFNNTSMMIDEDEFGIEHKGIYTFKATDNKMMALGNFITDTSYGKMMGGVHDYAIYGSERVEYWVVFFENISLFSYYRNNQYVGWLVLFHDDYVQDWTYKKNHWVNGSKWQNSSRNCSGWCAIVRNDDLEYTTNGFYYFVFEGELKMNSIYGVLQPKFKSATITRDAWQEGGSADNVRLYLEREAVSFKRGSNYYIVAYMDVISTEDVKRLACVASDSGDTLSFGYSYDITVADWELDGRLRTQAQLRCSGFDNGALMIGDFKSNSFDLCWIPCSGQIGRWVEQNRTEGNIKGCFIGCVSIKPFIPDNAGAAVGSMGDYYYFIMFDSSTNTYKMYRASEILNNASMTFNIVDVSSSFDMSFCEIDDYDNNKQWCLYYINWSAQEPFAVYRDNYVNVRDSVDDKYIVMKLDLLGSGRPQWMKNNVVMFVDGEPVLMAS